MGTATRQDVVTKAREFLGTPFRHQARLKGVGIDCVGLMLCTAHELGMFHYENAVYGRQPQNGMLVRILRTILDEVPIDDLQIADVMVFWIRPESKAPQHIAIRTDYGMIHTYADVGKVVETTFGKKWRRRLCHVFRFRELE
jgi:NlpC/P60 family putative phage cell wall peptidase